MLLEILFLLFTFICSTKSRPNFIVLLTDDQDIELGSLQATPFIRSALIDRGASFDHFYVNTPICCPSRSELISGRYYHNLGVPNGTCMHVNAKGAVFSPTGIFGQLHQSGYSTGVFGKLTNDNMKFWCNAQPELTFMSHIAIPCDQGNYYGQTYFFKTEDGSHNITKYPITPSLYQTSMISNHSVQWIREKLSKKNPKPFFAFIGPHAPHYSATVAPWYRNRFNSSRAPRTPNWNASCPDHHHIVSHNPPINAEAAKFIDRHWKDRLASLLSVDDMVKALISELSAHNALENTYIFYTSDHGYHLGQWRIPTSKQQLYETDIRVPFFVRGPGIQKKSLSVVAGNVDITPTILELAGLSIPSDVDGKSLVSLLMSDEEYVRPQSSVAMNWREHYLVEYLSVGTYDNDHSLIWWPSDSFQGYTQGGPRMNGNGVPWVVDSTVYNNWRGVRLVNASHNVMYAEFLPASWNFKDVVFRECYDLKTDPYQMRNVVDDVENKELVEYLHGVLMSYGVCQGKECP